MTTRSVKLTEAVERFLEFSEEKILFQRILHEFHDHAGEMFRLLKGKSVAGLAEEQKEFEIEERKLHLQAHVFEKSLHHYQKALTAAKTLVKKSTLVSFHGKKYQFIRKAEEIEIKLA